MTTSESIVQKQLDHYNNHDLDGFLSTYHEEVEIRSLVDDALMFRGKEQMIDRYRQRFEVDKVHAELANRIVIGNKVIDHEHVTGIEAGKIVKAVAIYEVEEDLIKKVWFLFE